ncbi:hypothetical protein NKH18_35380 [Streptomyces sp. M10(2022)]
MKHRDERRKLDFGRRSVAQHVTYKLFNHRTGFQRVPIGDLLKLPPGAVLASEA